MEIKTAAQHEIKMKQELSGHKQSSWDCLTEREQGKIWKDSFAKINEFMIVMNGGSVYFKA